MHDLMQLRQRAREIFDQALRAVDPLSAITSAVRIEKSTLIVGKASIDMTAREIYAIAIGKAAFKMAAGLNEAVGNRLSAGILCTGQVVADKSSLGPAWRTFHGGHPEPNEASLAAARAVFELLGAADSTRAVVIFLISGGGSTMIEAPANNDISLSDLQATNKVLVNCGASISEINAVRRSFSAVKGGKLAALASNCDQVTLIVSDVPEGEECNVASGPTIAPDATAFTAAEVMDRYQLEGELPSSVVRAVRKHPRLVPVSAARHEHFVLLANKDAQLAATEAARRHAFMAEMVPDISDQPIAQGCAMLLERLARLRAQDSDGNRVVCLISGGEFGCPAKGGGTGGRSLESALRLALLQSTSNRPQRFVALCGGTDGIDGNSPAAGAIVDSRTLERARARGLKAEEFLERSDSYSFFAALDDAIATGPTGTNVRDLRILLAE